jgi:hypothetical protein
MGYPMRINKIFTDLKAAQTACKKFQARLTLKNPYAKVLGV